MKSCTIFEVVFFANENLAMYTSRHQRPQSTLHAGVDEQCSRRRHGCRRLNLTGSSPGAERPAPNVNPGDAILRPLHGESGRRLSVERVIAGRITDLGDGDGSLEGLSHGLRCVLVCAPDGRRVIVESPWRRIELIMRCK